MSVHGSAPKGRKTGRHAGDSSPAQEPRPRGAKPRGTCTPPPPPPLLAVWAGDRLGRGEPSRERRGRRVFTWCM